MSHNELIHFVDAAVREFQKYHLKVPTRIYIGTYQEEVIHDYIRLVGLPTSPDNRLVWRNLEVFVVDAFHHLEVT